MTKRNSTKRALLASILSVVLCLSMLVGSTFAWFTDSASTGVNKIVAGELKIDLGTLDGTAFTSVKDETIDFIKADDSTQILWEPGCTYSLPDLYVKNMGNLAFKYQVVITGIEGSAKLNEAIEWTIDYGYEEGATEGHMAGNSTLSAPIKISGHMKEDAGNEYQGESIDGISVTVYATQDTVEYDSNNNQYDAGAAYGTPSFVTNADEFFAAINAGKTATLKNDITLDVPYLNLTLGTAETNSIFIDGNGHTITFNNGREEVWIDTVNPDAVVSINNATIGRSNPTVGNYLTFLSFYCNTNLTNVKAAESINLWGVGKTYNLTNVEIVDNRATAAHYAMFIKSGNTVTVDGCKFDNDEAGNRAIKISDVNSSEAEAQTLTTLTVKNTVFASNKKAAILVGTKYGANVTLENVDISAVAADTTNAVWVEDTYASYADSIAVTGGSKTIEK